MGVFGGVEKAKFSEGGNYLKDGVHRLQIVSAKHIKTLAQVDAYVVEFKVLESTNPAHVPGSLVSWMVQIKPNTPALGNISQFLQTALSNPGQIVAPEAITEEAVLYSCSEANPMKDRIVRASATNIKTKAKQQDFTKVRFLPDWEGAPAAA